MSFGGGDSAKKAWKDIWGSGQGIGAMLSGHLAIEPPVPT